jgi:acyl-CoA thioesterase I
MGTQHAASLPVAVPWEERLRYVAVGDSYTIGTSVAEADRWPTQLAGRIGELELVANLGADGATSADVIAHQLPGIDTHRSELVTLLIGVNDVVQGVSDSEYAANVALILDQLATRLEPRRIVGVAIPDYTVTPRGADYGDPLQQSDAIVRCNAILREACEQRGARFVPEIFELSRAASSRRGLLAPDRLHPSARQYRLWVEAIEPVVREVLAAPVAPAEPA